MSMRAMNIGVAGMKSGQDAMSIIANNIANDQTVGYKAQDAVFEEMFYQELKPAQGPSSSSAGSNPIDVGNGSKIGGVSTDNSQGNIVYTGAKTDAAIEGEGYFVVGNSDGGSHKFTRSGTFDTSSQHELITKNGQYVLGWNFGPGQTTANAGSVLEPIKIPVGQLSTPLETSEMSLKGNLNINDPIGTVQGVQVPTYDRIGQRHDIDMSFVKTSGSSYIYVANPLDVAKESASIENPILHVNEDTAPQLMKGDYQIKTAAGAGGTVNISVVDPTGSTLFTQNITDATQTLTLKNGAEEWFTIDYKPGGTPSTATYTVGEVGTVNFDSVGKLQSVTGSGAGGAPTINFTPSSTGLPVNIDLDMSKLIGYASTVGVSVDNVNGNGAAILTNFSITDGGLISAYYDDGSIRPIGQLALATFTNPSGLTRIGQGTYEETAASGMADIGIPGAAFKGTVKSQAVESSNVDLAKSFVDMLTNQKSFQANTKIITTTSRIEAMSCCEPRS